jgi:hypothetical protein
MPTDHILSLLIEEKNKIDLAIAALQGKPRAATPRGTESPASEAKPAPNHAPKRVWTPSMRLAAKRRAKVVWVRRRKAEGKKG